MRNAKLPDWEQVLSAAACLQRILPEAVLVGGTASAIYAQQTMLMLNWVHIAFMQQRY